MKTYIGIRDLDLDRCTVEVDGKPLDPRLDLKVYSAEGFEWGYWGDTPAQLALALLADATGDDELATELHQRFKVRVVAGLGGEWRLTEAMIVAWSTDNRRPPATSLAASSDAVVA